MKKPLVWLGAVALSLGICTVSAIIGWAAGTSGNPQPAVVSLAPSKPSGGLAAGTGNSTKSLLAGTWAVGTEVKPGTYTTTGTGPNCYWARLKNFDGELESVISNGNIGPGEHGRFTVKASDKGVELNGDCVWTRG